MPLLILGTVVFTSVIFYMYMLNHGNSLITRKAPPRGASNSSAHSNVIYLPQNPDAGKDKTDRKN